MPYTREDACSDDNDCGQEGFVCEEGKCVERPVVEPDSIGRVIIARGNIPWDVKPPEWDNILPPCCIEPDLCKDITCEEGFECIDGNCEPITEEG